MKKLEDYVITIPDFPEEGIMFRDITGILKEADGIRLAEDELMEKLEGVEFDAIVGLESRGFLFGMPMAYTMQKPFIPIRKKGKLPRETVERTYDLEYGTATIDVHKEDIFEGEKLVLVDDLLATGGTMEAACRLVESLGGEVVKILFLLELEGLNGRAKLEGYDIESLVKYPGK